FVRDRLATEAPDGLLDGGRHLRLDDDWQAGGIWRCEQVEGPSSVRLLPPDLPLHLGLTEGDETPDQAAHEEPQPGTVTVQSCRVILTGRDIGSGRLRLSGTMVGALAKTDELTLRLRHDGETSQGSVTVDRSNAELRGVPWPPSFYPGIQVQVNAE